MPGMPLVVTGYEPSGGQSIFSQGWRLTSEKVFNKGVAGTLTNAAYKDASIPSLTGIDLWPVLSINSLYGQIASKALVYYISLWRNPPAILGTGIDYFRVISVQKS
jgi:hypothetical protein